MEKFDLIKRYKSYYTAKVIPEIIDIEEAQFIAINGEGAPEGSEFQSKISALYPLAYAIKMMMKKESKDFTVAKLEGLWWIDSDKPFLETPRERWKWKLLLRQPDFVTPKIVELAKQDVLKKKGVDLVKEITFEKLKEGRCIQALHTGPYSTELKTWEKIQKLMEERELIESGLHHEIYLVGPGPRKVPEEKWRTILRQPVKKRIL